MLQKSDLHKPESVRVGGPWPHRARHRIMRSWRSCKPDSHNSRSRRIAHIPLAEIHTAQSPPPEQRPIPKPLFATGLRGRANRTIPRATPHFRACRTLRPRIPDGVSNTVRHPAKPFTKPPRLARKPPRIENGTSPEGGVPSEGKGSGEDHPLTAPAVTPAMMYFWQTR